MKFADTFMRVLVVAAFLVLLLSPHSSFALVFAVASFIAMGLWAVWLPAGIIGWAKIAHRQLRDDDEAALSVARYIGAGFILIGTVILLAMLYHS